MKILIFTLLTLMSFSCTKTQITEEEYKDWVIVVKYPEATCYLTSTGSAISCVGVKK